MRRIGAIEFATTIAPGLRDVLLTGKIREIVTARRTTTNSATTRSWWIHRPPAGSRGSSTSQGGVGTGQAGGRCTRRPRGVVNILHSENTAIHLVTLLESLPIQETIEAIIEELRELDLPIGSVIVNRNIPTILPSDALLAAADGVIDAETVRADLGKVGVKLADADAGLHRDHRARHPDPGPRRERRALDEIDVPRLELPAINDGIDPGSPTSWPGGVGTTGSPLSDEQSGHERCGRAKSEV